MPDSLVDIGQGIKVVGADNIGTGANGLENFQKTLSILDLQGKIANQPLERQQKEAELKILENNVANIGLNNEMLNADFTSKKAKEQRDQTQFLIENIGKGFDAFRVDPNLAGYILDQTIPGGATYDDNKDGTYTVTTKVGGKKFLANPNKITDPEKLKAFEAAQKDDFNKSVTPFVNASTNYRNIIKLSNQPIKDDKAGLRDLSVFVNYIKLINPAARINEETIQQFDGTEGIFGQLGSLFSQVKSGKKLDEGQLQSIKDSAKIHFQTQYEDAISTGQNVYKGAKIQNLDPRLIIQPTGGLQYEDFLPASELSDEQLKARVVRKRALGLIGE